MIADGQQSYGTLETTSSVKVTTTDEKVRIIIFLKKHYS